MDLFMDPQTIKLIYRYSIFCLNRLNAGTTLVVLVKGLIHTWVGEVDRPGT